MNIFHSATKMVMDAGEAISNATSAAGQVVMDTATGVGGAVGNTASAAGKTAIETAIGVSGAMASTASQVGDAVLGTAVASGVAVHTTAIQATQAAVEIATKTGAEAIALAMSRIVQECTVPAFLLPTGSGCRDFKCTFCFEEAIKKLTSGILVRPQVQVWAGREDIDRTHLTEILKQDFICQFNAARERARTANQRAYDSKIANLKSQQEQSGQEAGKVLQSAVGFVVTALLFMFFVANPIFNIIFLSCAIFGSIDGITKGLNYLHFSFQVSSDQDKLRHEQQKLEADFDSKNEAFKQAINNITIHIHPMLQEVITLFSELDNRPFFPINIEQPTTEIPLVNELLQKSNYLEEVPLEYLPLLDLFL